MDKSDRMYFIDVLNVISALAVIFLHVNGCFWGFDGEESISWWISADIIESLFYFAVPVFFMITGATLLDYNKKYGIKEYAKKRIIKTFIPYIVWSLLGLIVNIVLGDVLIQDINVKYIIKGLIECSFVRVFWFFTPLFCVYFSIPLLAAVEQEQKIKIYKVTLIIALVTNIFIPFVKMILGLELSWGYQIAVASGYLFYVLTGYVVSRVEIKKTWRICLYILSVGGLLLHLVGTYVLTVKDGFINETFKGYNSFQCVLYSVGIFIFFKQISECFSEKVLMLFSTLSRYTFGVYLVHIFIVKGIEKFSGISNTNLLYRIIIPFIVFALAVFISWLGKKIPFVKHIIP